MAALVLGVFLSTSSCKTIITINHCQSQNSKTKNFLEQPDHVYLRCCNCGRHIHNNSVLFSLLLVFLLAQFHSLFHNNQIFLIPVQNDNIVVCKWFLTLQKPIIFIYNTINKLQTLWHVFVSISFSALSENTHPQVHKATNLNLPDISRPITGQM